ncbi:MAG: methyltransferase domain-containing protein [Anaerolineales bacterium]|nr:methyltransferase domain-containing protein [Chloroflexota bacterium]MBL6982215.1 methyltransferase domain-containing protein [Anaerolineales bacterium]
MHKKAHTHAAKPKTEGNTLDGMAPFYDKFVQMLTLGKDKKTRLETISLAKIKPGEQVLEVGCGTGSLAIAAAQKVETKGAVFGIDPAPKMIEIAQRKTTKANLLVEYRVGVIEDLPYPDNSMDIVLSSLMMHHLPDHLKTIGLIEVNRVLKPGGRLAIVELDSSRFSLINFVHGRITSENRFALELKQLMLSNGFCEVEIKDMRYGSLTFLMGTKLS